MLRSPASVPALALAAAAALALVSCGGEDAQLLPGGTAREITANLDTVQQLSGEGDCIGAESAAQQVGEQIEALEGVDRKLKQALEEGAVRLNEVIAECDEAAAESTPSAPVPAEDEDTDEKEEKDEEKEREEAEKEREKAEKESEAADEGDDAAPPPQANGEAKGQENGNGPPASEETEESPSGGVSPGAPAGEAE